MRSNHTLTITVNAPDTIGCTDIDGGAVLDRALTTLEQVVHRVNRDYGSDVRVDRAGATVETTEAEAEATATGADAPLTMDNVTDETIVNAVNGLAETVAWLTALAERAERYLR
jgi:hypothetical protein